VGEFIEQLGAEEAAVQSEQVGAKRAEACACTGGFELGQGGEFVFVRIGEDNFTVGEYFEGAAECGFRPLRAFGDGADFAGLFSEEGYYLGCLGIIDSAYADSCIFY